jgi:putative ABC transport system substrate-binding protein
MRRREFLTLLGSATAWPIAARAQRSGLPVIGLLISESADEYASRLPAFRQGLTDSGYVEGKNVTIEYRWADGRYDRLPALAAELVRRRVTVIVANTPAAQAAKAATGMIPIVFSSAADPVELGLVGGLARPGGNVTGVTNLSVELEPKRLELLHELVPGADPIGVLVNPTNRNAGSYLRGIQAAAATLDLKLHILQASTIQDIDTVFASLTQLRLGGLVIGTDPFFYGRSEQLGALSLRYAMPAIYSVRDFAAAGGLISYGDSLTTSYHLVGIYTGRVLNGEKPADLPVQQATKVEMTINLKTAKALGITMPLPLLGRADEVIE